MKLSQLSDINAALVLDDLCDLNQTHFAALSLSSSNSTLFPGL